MIYAIIIDGAVTNLIYLSPSNAGDFPDAVPTHGLPVMIGDAYADGVFTRDGVVVEAGEMSEYRAALEVLGVDTRG